MRSFPRLLALLLALCAVVLVASSVSAQSSSELDRAAALAAQGQYDEAIDAYLEIVDGSDDDARLAARLGVAQVYLDDGQNDAAIEQLDAYLIEALADTDVRPAQYLLAEALTAEEQWSEALPLYDAYIEQSGPATAYARAGRAFALARAGRLDQAVNEADGLLDGDATSPAHAEQLALILAIAQALEGDRPNNAISWYERLARESDTPADDALATWQIARLGEGNDFEAWSSVITDYPESPVAQEIVDQSPPTTNTTVAIDPYYTGLVKYRAGQVDEAKADFAASVERSDGTPAGRSSYYLGVIEEEAGNAPEAIAAYAAVRSIDPESELAPDSLWWQARLTERTSSEAAARGQYEELVADHGSSGWASEARFRLALLDYDAKDYAAAASGFEQLANGDDTLAQRARLWQGKALAAAGDSEAATQVWTALRNDAPGDYYGLRAAVLLGETGPQLDSVSIGESDIDWAAIETWLAEDLDTDPEQGLDILLLNPHWRLGQELLFLGMNNRANAEFSLLIDAADGDPADLYQLARRFHESGLTHHSARAATLLVEALEETGDPAVIPSGLLRLAYPTAYPDLVQDAADEHDLPPALLLAVARQESFFDPLAGSEAGALGLMQIVPDTGEKIAQDAAFDDYTVDDLYRPSVSLEFGARYLRDQLDTSDGDVYQALAAYNGGPIATERWAEASGEDVDRFVAEIEFAQTEAYVQLVMENVARYSQLYGDLSAPALPED
jgi:soluble lytic murein transglycosylase